MGRLIINNAMTVNGAFEAPSPEPDGWLVLDTDSQGASLEMLRAADAMVLGRKTYEGLAAVWPQLGDVPGFEVYAERINSMPKYVASRTLSGPLEWNSTLLEGDLTDSVSSLKGKHSGNLIVSGAGELARDLLAHGLVDEVLVPRESLPVGGRATDLRRCRRSPVGARRRDDLRVGCGEDLLPARPGRHALRRVIPWPRRWSSRIAMSFGRGSSHIG